MMDIWLNEEIINIVKNFKKYSIERGKKHFQERPSTIIYTG
jgi:hypothetical protein